MHAVVLALELEDDLSSGETTGETDRVHGRLGAGVCEAHPIGPAQRLHHLLCSLDLETLGHGERGSTCRRGGNGGDNGLVAMTEDYRAEPALVVDVTLAIHVVDMPALTPIDDQRVLVPPITELARHTVYQVRRRALEPLRGLVSLQTHVSP